MSKDYKNSDGPITKEDFQPFKEVFDAFEKDTQAYDFLEPVDYIGKKFN
jgi:hypothetical protein